MYLIKNSSTSLAAALPSVIAQTTRLCPLCISPAVKTLWTLDLYLSCSVATFVLAFSSTPKAEVTYSSEPRKPTAISSISHLNNAERMVDHWNAYYTKYLNLIDSDLKSCDFTELIANCFLTAKQIWFSYYGFSQEKKNRYFFTINDICLFVRKHFSAIICNRELSFKMKLISPFLLFKCKFVFWYLQKSKAVVNKIKPVDNNICLFFP